VIFLCEALIKIIKRFRENKMKIKRYKWSESISTGDPALDLQHKQFFVVLHDFADDLEQGKGAKNLKSLLIFLKSYGEWHFGKEEGSCSCANCPMGNENINAHKHYITTINSSLETIRTVGTSESLAHSTYEQLANWLMSHIMQIDKRNAVYLKSLQRA
jgi:hemerythrin